METLNKLKLLAYNVFMVLNPMILIATFLVSFFSGEFAVSMLSFLHWFFGVTLLLAAPQFYQNYKMNSNGKK